MHEEDFGLCVSVSRLWLYICSRARMPSPAATQDPAAGTVSGGASGQRLICPAEPGRWLGHQYTSKKHTQDKPVGTEAKHRGLMHVSINHWLILCFY